MFEDDALLEILGEGWLVADKPSDLTCPKCAKAKLQFHLDAHLYRVYGTDFPRIGDEIDGCIKKNGKLHIPWFTLDAAKVTHDIPDDLKSGQRITLRVTRITTAKPIDTVRSLFYRRVVTDLGLEYIGKLPENRR